MFSQPPPTGATRGPSPTQFSQGGGPPTNPPPTQKGFHQQPNPSTFFGAPPPTNQQATGPPRSTTASSLFHTPAHQSTNPAPATPTPGPYRSTATPVALFTNSQPNTPASEPPRARSPRTLHHRSRPLPRPPGSTGKMSASSKRPAAAPSSGNSAHSVGSARRHRYRLPPVRPKARVTPLSATHASPIAAAVTEDNNSVAPESPSVTKTEPASVQSVQSELPKVEQPRTEEKVEDSLPEGWVEAKDPDSGKAYYYNASTGVTSWERPAVPPPTTDGPEQTFQQPETESATLDTPVVPETEEVAQVATEAVADKMPQPETENISDLVADPSLGDVNSTTAEEEPANDAPKGDAMSSGVSFDQQQALPDGWVEAQDPSSGKTYYYNASTGATSWERPAVPPPTTEDGPEQTIQQPETESATLDTQVVPETEEVAQVAKEAVADTMLQPETENISNLVADPSLGDVNSTAAEEEPANDAPKEGAAPSCVSFDQQQTLPDGWVEAQDPSSGKTYYYNGSTGETSWERPPMPNSDQSTTGPMPEVTASQADSLPDGWAEMMDPTSGRTYYYHAQTNTTSWERPSVETAVEEQYEQTEEPVDSNEAIVESTESVPEDSGEPLVAAVEDFNPIVENEEGTSPEEVTSTYQSFQKEPAVDGQSVNVDLQSEDDVPERAAEPNTELSSGWIEITDPSSGKVYYYNSSTNETSWERPVPPDSVVQPSELEEASLKAVENDEVEATVPTSTSVVSEQAAEEVPEEGTVAVHENRSVEEAPPEIEVAKELPQGWVEATDPSNGNVYFYNAETDETSWERPAASGDEVAVSVSAKEEDRAFDSTPLDESNKSDSGTQNPTFAIEQSASTNVEETLPMKDTTSSVAVEQKATSSNFGSTTVVESTGFEAESIDTTTINEQASVNILHGATEDVLIAGVLQEGWTENTDPSTGQTYYFNSVTQETSWERPSADALSSEAERTDAITKDGDAPELEGHGVETGDEAPVAHENLESDLLYVDPSHASEKARTVSSHAEVSARQEESSELSEGWIQAVDPASGRTYYYNSTTTETSWERPGPFGGGDDDEHESLAIDSNDPVDSHETETQDSSSDEVELTPSNMGIDQASVGPSHQSHQDEASTGDRVIAQSENTSLPTGWVEGTDPSTGQKFYFHATTNETSWKRPVSSTGEDSRHHEVDEFAAEPSLEDVPQTPHDKEKVEPEKQPSPEQVLADQGEDEIVFDDGAVAERDASASNENEVGLFDSPGVWVSSNRFEEEKSTSGIDAGLPEGWLESNDPSSGQTYYYNSFTNESSWERPTKKVLEAKDEAQNDAVGDVPTLAAAAEADIPEAEVPATSKVDDAQEEKFQGSLSTEDARAVLSKAAELSTSDLAPGWVEVTDPNSGQVYYYNAETEESAWERPTKKTETALDSKAEQAQSIQPEVTAAVSRGENEDGDNNETEPLVDAPSKDKASNFEDEREAAPVVDTKDTASSSDLMPGWEEATDPDTGDIFYFNPESNETSWDRPVLGGDIAPETAGGLQEDIASVTAGASDDAENTSLSNRHINERHGPETEGSLPVGWVKTTDPTSGETYYYNSETNETSWDRPDCKSVRSDADGTGRHEVPSSETASALTREEDTNTVQTNQSASAQPHTEQVAAGTQLADTPPEPGLEADLPQGWEAVTDPSTGETYFYNENTGETSWDHPGSNSTVDSQAPQSIDEKESQSFAEKTLRLPEGWIEATDPSSGQLYFYNARTSETSWERPHEGVADNQDAQSSVDKPTEIMEAEEKKPTGESAASVAEVDTDRSAGPGKSVTTDLLPTGWEELMDPNSQTPYYYNSKTDETSWSRPNTYHSSDADLGVTASKGNAPDSDVPQDWEKVDNQKVEDSGAGLSGSSAPEDLPEGWVKSRDPSTQQTYYYNTDTGETSWTIPRKEEVVSDDWEVVSKGIPPDKLTGKEAATNVGASSARRNAVGRPNHAAVCLGFGGQLCRVAKGRPGHIEVRQLHKAVVNDSFVNGTLEKHLHGIYGPLRRADDEKVNSYLFHHESDMLWKLIQIASKAKGRLRSLKGASDPSTPESKIVKLLLSFVSREESHEKVEDGSSDGTSSRPQIQRKAIEDLLVRGEREKAVEIALNEKQYALALLVAGMCGRDTYQMAAKRFCEDTLEKGSPLHTVAVMFSAPSQANESSTLYSLFSNDGILIDNWMRHLASIINNRIPGWEYAVESLGDRLQEVKCYEAAHFCYMVCGTPIASPVHRKSRWTLVGCNVAPADIMLQTDASLKAFHRTEAYEWAKRQGNANATLKTLVAFKVLYAFRLSEYGFQKDALDYVIDALECLGEDRPKYFDFSQPVRPLGLSVLSGEKKGLLVALHNLYERLVAGSLSSATAADEPRNKFEERLQKAAMEPKPTELPAKESEVKITETKAKQLVAAPQAAEFMTPPNPQGSNNLQSKQGTDKSEDHSEAIKKEPSMAFHAMPIPPHSSPVKFGSSANRKAPPSTPIQRNGPGGGMPSQKPPLIPGSKTSAAPQTPTMSKAKKAESAGETKAPVAAGMQTPDAKKVPAAPASAPANLHKGSQAETPSSSRKKGWFDFGIKDYFTKKFNPDATTADLGGSMDAYFDEKQGRWIFPGDDPNDVPAALGPPPTTPMAEKKPEEEKTAEKEEPAAPGDPLALMMAPPSRRPVNKKTQAKGAGATIPGLKMPSTGAAASGKAPPPQFSVFKPPS